MIMSETKVEELKGKALERAQLYHAGATHSIRVPFKPGVVGPQFTVGAVTYDVGCGIDPDGRSETIELFCTLAKPASGAASAP